VAKASKVASPPAAKPKFCVSKIREVAEIKQCNVKLKNHPLGGEYCPNRDNHLYPIPTGFCSSGWHEGMKARTESGKPAPTCRFYVNCPCDCHTKLNRMYQLAGEERVLVDNSDWKPESTFVMPSLEPLDAVSSIDTGTDTRPVVESPAPGIVPPTVVRTFVPTQSGRLGKGQLEAWVKEVTDVWVVEQERPCTVGYISNEIGRVKGIDPPSQGAIQNVLFRWRDIGFAVLDTTRPMKFTGYTDEGVRLGLDNLKARAKRHQVK